MLYRFFTHYNGILSKHTSHTHIDTYGIGNALHEAHWHVHIFGRMLLVTRHFMRLLQKGGHNNKVAAK